MEQMKTCRKCGVEKPILDFGKRNNTFKAECKSCVALQDRMWRENNKEKVLEKAKKYRENNPEKIKEAMRKWLLNNRDKALANTKKWREENLEYSREKARQWYEQNKEKALETKIKRRANLTVDERLELIFKNTLKGHVKRRIEFNITLEDIKTLWSNQNGLCIYTKLPLSPKGYQLNTISLDRIDSSKGYIVGNIQLVCSAINRMKSTYSEIEFVYFCNLVSLNSSIIDNSEK